jgi:hypothetical protein
VSAFQHHQTRRPNPGKITVAEVTMAKKRKTGGGPEQAMRQAALRCPDVEEGIACKGTAVECSAFKARKKTFLFVRAEDARVKLHESLVEADGSR